MEEAWSRRAAHLMVAGRQGERQGPQAPSTTLEGTPPGTKPPPTGPHIYRFPYLPVVPQDRDQALNTQSLEETDDPNHDILVLPAPMSISYAKCRASISGAP